MSTLRIIVPPDFAHGFGLAGVETFAADSSQTAEVLLANWLFEGQAGLVAIDEALLQGISPSLLKRLENSWNLFHIAIPVGKSVDTTAARQARIAALIRQAIGFHITFQADDEK